MERKKERIICFYFLCTVDVFLLLSFFVRLAVSLKVLLTCAFLLLPPPIYVHIGNAKFSFDLHELNNNTFLLSNE